MTDRDLPGHEGSPIVLMLVRRHLRIGWLAVLLFLLLGLVLETLHGFKVDWYLNVTNETRRHMWTLAHAHGVLLGVLNLSFAWTMRTLAEETGAWRRVASHCLAASTVLLPLGFLLGGIVVYSGDPGRGVLLVPIGAVFLACAILLTAWRAMRWSG